MNSSMTTFEKLIRHFERFPGIGSRQARRFAQHLLTESKEDITELADLIAHIQSSVIECKSCFRFFVVNNSQDICPKCADPARNKTQLMVVEGDSDMLAIERAGLYDGFYFVLGGLAPLIESKETGKLRGSKLKHIVSDRAKHDGLKEIILGFSVNPDGENTARYVKKLLRDDIDAYGISVSMLGRGLSTGSELEYADAETIKNALQNRS